MMTSNRKSLRFQTTVNYMKKSKYNYRLRLLDYDNSMPEPYHIHKSNRTQTFRPHETIRNAYIYVNKLRYQLYNLKL